MSLSLLYIYSRKEKIQYNVMKNYKKLQDYLLVFIFPLP